ncbi:hypothetical protein CALCODRAFT_479459 [Calocera cornea HHB12733]|uniref:Fungal calcium binding protein domain-containing protein n=1 Tax=Calocera cornea HHB12733 TaxID=1353952 RepID=A0A165JKV8_9BASI|nr:hypothetical protein CALCODRAFT_479459 [Calocera cornea HHB12733]
MYKMQSFILAAIAVLAFLGLANAALIPRSCDLTKLAPTFTVCYEAVEGDFGDVGFDVQCLEDAVENSITLPAACSGCL